MIRITTERGYNKMQTQELTSLNGRWKLVWAHHQEVKQIAGQISTVAELKERLSPGIDVTVPGNFIQDLFAAGRIEDPYFGMNPLQAQKFESCHTWYYTEFDYSGSIDDNLFLRFDGIDTFADIYLNGTFLASTDNMLIAHEFPVPMLKHQGNELIVHIKPTTITAREQIPPAGSMAMSYNADALYTRKAAHMFGWDIFPRILSAGLWRSVSLIHKNPERFREVFAYTMQIDHRSNRAGITVFFDTQVLGDDVREYSIVAKGSCGNSHFFHRHKLWHTFGKFNFAIENVQLWWPKNAGAQNLYDTVFELYHGDTLVDIYSLRLGVRTVKLDRTSITDMNGAGEFCFHINGKKIFMCGTNWVGADALPSNDHERLPKLLALLDDIGCNMVRCWGGSVYDEDAFYDFCDDKGILVWQDFAMGCAVYPQDEQFAQSMSKEVIQVVKRLRNHPCLAMWAGDNECDYAYAYWSGIDRDPNQNVITRQVIPSLLELHDYTRPYLPSSPYLDAVAYREGKAFISEEHLWGPRDYYKSPFYVNSTCHFASEIGYHGCPSPQSIPKFISREAIWPWQNNQEWLVHATSPSLDETSPYLYRIELMAKQIRELFGTIPDTLQEFALASQISQAEAFKSFIELFRCSKWRRTGILWWNLADGWPQFSDAVVDYYFTKKLAYHYIKRAQQPVCLMFKLPENWTLSLMASNDTPERVCVHYKVTDISENGTVLIESECSVEPDSAVAVWNTPYSMSDKKFYLIEWTIGDVHYKNHYLSGNPTFDLAQYIAWASQAQMLDLEGFEAEGGTV